MSSFRLPRRTFLRGLGTAVALPLLDSMLPLKAIASAAPTGPVTSVGLPRRMAFVYVPNGVNMEDWVPVTEGTNFDMPKILEPLARHRNDITVVSGLGHANSRGGGGHARASSTYLTGVQARKTAGADIRNGISVDQVAAQQIGRDTRLPSLELTCDSGKRSGSCDSGCSCAYQYNISWRSETMPMNPESDPRLAFERLFGSSHGASSREATARRALYNKSVLDAVLDDAKSLQRNLGVTDTRKLDEYLTAVREIEQRIERNDKFPAHVPQGVEAPGMFENYPDHVRLMFDIMTLAFQTDTTRISTFIMAHEGSNRPHPFIGIPEGHHDLSHHRNDEGRKAKLAQINRFHVSQFSTFLDRLKAVPEGEGTLLDNCMIVYGSGISDGNSHNKFNLPTLLAGRGGGTITPGRHINAGNEVPMSNFHMSLLDRLGVQTEKIGDSTGKIEAIGQA